MQINILNRVNNIFPLSIHSSGRYFVDKNGNPFLIKGDSGWSLPNQLTRAQINTYLGKRRQQEFSAILFQVPVQKFSSQTPATNNVNGDAPFTDFNDWTTVVEAYWANVDYIINTAWNLNLACFITPAYLGFNGGDEGFMVNITANTNAHLQAYGAWLANRYTQKNIIWVMGGDYAGTVTERDKQWQVVTGMRTVRTTDIITGHPSRTHDAYEYWSTYTGFSANTIYTDGTEYGYAATAYGRAGPLPFVLIEAEYEDEGVADTTMLVRQSVAPILAGGCGSFYGNNPVWGFGEPVANHGVGPAASLTSLSTSNSANQINVWRLFANLNWQTLVPKTDTSLVTTSLGSGSTRIVPALSSDNRLAVIWSNNVDFTVNMTAFTASPVRARWYNPFGGLGVFTDDAASPLTNTGTHAFSTPGTNNKILVLDVPSTSPSGPTRYVRTDGSDSNNGLTDTAGGAWSTLQKAADTAQPGWTIIVRPGTYVGFAFDPSRNSHGTASQPIIFTADTGDYRTSNVIINAIPAAASAQAPVWIWSSGYIIVQGFNVTSNTSKGNFTIGSTSPGCQIISCHSYGTPNWGVKTGIGVTNVLIYDCLLEDSSGEHGIYVAGTDGYIIRGNTCRNNNANGIHTNVEDGGGTVGQSTNTNGLIENNICTGNNLAAMDFTGMNNSVVQNNLCYGNGRHGMVLQNSNGNATPACHDNVVANNTFNTIDGSSAYGIEIAALQSQPVGSTWTSNGDNTTVFNNILLSQTGSGNGSIGLLTTLPATFVSDYHAVVNKFTLNATGETLAQWQTATSQDAHSFVSTAAALFTNSAGNDYTLAGGSPAIAAGVSTLNGESAPARNILGVSRGTSFNLGCY